jgi:pyrimidine operon attenuation protein/uracil phosphoribosyltransferase
MRPAPDAEAAFEVLCERVRSGIRAGVRLVGIHSGGVWLARRLARELGLSAEVGEIDIAYYRDDFDRIGLHSVGRPTLLPFEVANADLLLVDDVLFTGRTIRGALNVLFDYGRPNSVELATLFDRGGRELPISANYCGANVSVGDAETLVLREQDGRFAATFETITTRNA